MTHPVSSEAEEWRDEAIQPDVAQRKASNPESSIWVGASAGSGKTKVLADRVIRLLLDGVRPEKILCLTFTRAAAAEMSIRITRQLARWATCDDDTLRGDLDKLQTTHAPSPEQVDNARRLFARVLACPGGMRIRTIHAFGQEILRRFPVEAGLPPHFAVMEEADAHALWIDSQNDVLQMASTAPDKPEGRALQKLVRDMGEQSFVTALRDVVKDMPRVESAAQSLGGFKHLIARLRSVIDLGPKDTEETVRAEAFNERNLPRQRITWAAKVLVERGSKMYRGRGQAMLDWLALPVGENLEEVDSYVRAFFKENGEPYASLGNKELLYAQPELEPVLKRETARLQSVLERLDSARIADRTAALLTLAQAVAARFTTRKASRAMLDYDDLIRRTEELLGRPGIAPWVLFKLDGGVDHVLVDEAQDTSPEQWRIIKALTEEFFAGLGARSSANRTLFVVGDEKQSIYSFLKADPDEFQRMRDYFRDRIKSAKRNWDEVPMNVSFRSAPAILRAVDAVFADEAARQGVAHEAVRHAAFHQKAKGSVEVWPLVPAAEKEESEWALPLHYETERNPVVELAEQIAARIEAWRRQGLPIYDRKTGNTRAMTYDDVMVLVRKRRPFVDPLVRALKQQRVPVAGADRMRLTDQLAVKDLVALMRFTLLPEDDLTLAAVLRGPLLGCGEDQLMELAIGRKGALWTALKSAAPKHAAWQPVVAYLERRLAQADEISPFAWLARILGSPCPADERSGRRALWKRLGPDALDPMDELLNAAQQFGARHTPSLQAFVQWLGETEAQIKREMEQASGQVRIVTVHSAKGLEAPLVILPDAASAPSASDTPSLLWHEGHQVPFYLSREPHHVLLRGLREQARRKQLEEYRRLMYVAMTRAADRLVICGWETARKEGFAESWYSLARAALSPLHAPWAAEDDATPAPDIVVTDERPSSPRERTTGAIATDLAATASDSAVALPAWALCPPEPEPLPPKPLAPSRPDEDEPSFISPQDKRFARGRLIHRLLQSLPDVAPERQENAAARFLANPQHALTTHQQQEIVGEVLALLRHDMFAPLFGSDSRAEVPIVGIVDNRVIAGQVDRLCIRDNEVWIVDYKTNRPPPSSARDIPKIYARQLEAYRAVLRKIYPGKAVKTFLLWTYGPRLMLVP